MYQASGSGKSGLAKGVARLGEGVRWKRWRGERKGTKKAR